MTETAWRTMTFDAMLSFEQLLVANAIGTSQPPVSEHQSELIEQLFSDHKLAMDDYRRSIGYED